MFELQKELENKKILIELYEEKLKKEKEEKSIIEEKLNKMYQILKKFNDRDRQIFVEKRMYKWSDSKISVNHCGLSRQQISRIVNRIEEEISNAK